MPLSKRRGQPHVMQVPLVLTPAVTTEPSSCRSTLARRVSGSQRHAAVFPVGGGGVACPSGGVACPSGGYLQPQEESASQGIIRRHLTRDLLRDRAVRSRQGETGDSGHAALPNTTSARAC